MFHTAHVVAVRLPVSIPMVAKDVRHFQHRLHDAGSGRRDHLQIEPIERANGLGEDIGCHLRIERGGGQVIMPQQNLNDTQISAALQEVGGKAVPKRMHRHVLGETGCLARSVTRHCEHFWIDMTARITTGKQPNTRAGPQPIGAQNLQQLFRQHGLALFAALPVLDPDQHALAVDVAGLEGYGFGQPQPGCIGCGQGDTAFEPWHGFEEANHLLPAEHYRQLAWVAGA